MLARLYNSLNAFSRAKNIWRLGITTLVFLILYNLVKLPDWLAGQLGYSGPPRLFALDLQFNYSPVWVYTTLTSYGEQGRHIYAYALLIFDFIFPATYTLFLTTALTALLNRTGHWQKLSLLALLPGLMDWQENFGILGLLYGYPRHLNLLAELTNLFTLAKYLLTILSLLLIVVSLVFTLVKGRMAHPKLSAPQQHRAVAKSYPCHSEGRR